MKKILLTICWLIIVNGCSPANKPETSSSQFVFVKIPDKIMPVERGTKYAEPLEATLRKEKVGEVTGGGTQMSEHDIHGNKNIEWVGLDVDLVDFNRGLPILKTELVRLGAPKGTVLEYTRDGVKHSEPIK